MTFQHSGFRAPSFFVSKLFLSLLTAGALALSSSALQAQATAPALSLGSVNVGASATGTVTFTYSGNTTVSSVSVVTQGATGLDFVANGASTCVQSSPTNGTTCTVPVKFTPLYPGGRLGAVLLVGTSGTAVATGYISGTGVGPLSVFQNGSLATTFSPSLNGGRGVSVDSLGNVYVAEQGASSIDKFSPSGTETVLTTSTSGDSGALDGAGNYYFGATGGIYELVGGVPGTPVQVESGFFPDNGMGVDGAGNLYAAVSSGSDPVGTIYEVLAGGPSIRTNVKLVTGTGARFIAITSDVAGNIYTANFSANILYKLPAGTGTLTQIASGSPMNGPHAVALDPAGDLYVGNYNSSQTILYSAGTYIPTVLTTITAQTSITVGPGGNIYTMASNSNLYGYTRTQTAAPTASSSVNYTSPVVQVPVLNTGNAASTLLTTAATAPFITATSGSTCQGGTTAPAAPCTDGYQFSPTSTTTPQTGTLTLGFDSNPSLTANLTGNVSGTATKVVFNTPPAASVAAGGTPGTVSAYLEDANGYYVTTPGVSVSLSSTYAGTTTYPTATTAASGGLATFTTTTPALTTAGTYTYTAASSGLTSATASETVTPGAATHLSATPSITSAYVGQAVAITVKALDQYGNVATTDTDTVSLAATPSTAMLTPNFTLTSGSGSGSVTFTATGTYTVTAQDVSNTGVTSGTTTTITVGNNLPIFVVGTLADDATATAANCPDTANGGTANTTCTLRDAVAAATAANLTGQTGPQATITFAPSIYAAGATPTCTVSSITPAGGSTAITTSAPCIVLNASSTVLSVGANVNIVGPGPALLAVSAVSGHNILAISAASLNVAVSGLTFTLGGGSYGGAIMNGNASVALALSNDVFYKNSGYYGGAVYDYRAGSTLTITNSSFDANAPTIQGSGGAIYLTTGVTLTVSGSSFTNNKVTSQGGVSAYGGAIYANGALPSTIKNSLFSGNTVNNTNGASYGGAVYSFGGSGNDTYTGTVFIGNKVSSTSLAEGGALYYATKTLTLIDSLVQGNSVTSSAASGYGGGVYSVANPYLYNTTVTGNYAKYEYGGVYSALYAYNSIIEGNNAGTSYTDASAVSASSGSLINVNSATTYVNPLLSAPSNTGSFAGPTGGAGAYTTVLPSVVPLPGSPALRTGTTSMTACTTYPTGFASGTNCLAGQSSDARGYARTQTVGSTTYVDAGETEASYTAAYVFQPANTVVGATITGQTSLGATSPFPSVQLYEQGQPFAFSYFVDPTAGTTSETTITTPLPLTVSAGAGTLTGTATPAPATATVASTTAYDFGAAETETNFSGLFNLSGLSISPAETNDTLLSAFCVGACSGTKQNLVVASNPFNVGATIAFTTPPPADLPINTSPGTVVVKEYNSSGTAYVSGDTVTLTVTGTAATNYTATYTATSSNGTFTFTPAALAAADTYTYTATDTTYTTQTAVATETVSTQLLGSLAVSGFPSPDHNGTANNVTVTAYDTTGALFTGFNGTVTLTSSDPLATLPAAYTFTGTDAGAHTFSVTLATGGKQTIKATSGSISGSETNIVVDDFIWLVGANGATAKLSETASEQAVTTTSNTTGAFGGVAFDSTGNAWSVTSGSNSLLETTKADGSPTTFAGTGGLSTPVSVAVDGAGMIWVANSGNNSVSEFTNAGVAQSGTSGYGSSTLSGPSQVNIDNTGGVWVSNKTGSSLTHIFGAATPVISPTAAAVTNGTTGQKP
jgi:hypothetical protein